LFASSMLLSRVQKNTHDLEQIEPVVRSRLAGQVRFCSNNEQFTKLLMQHDWHYAYCLAVGQDYCGMSVPEAFSTFPFLRREACQRIVATYRVNACLLDRQQYETLFDETPPQLASMVVAFESPRLRLLILDWTPAAGEPAAA
jgi:hypothetical protein